MNYNWVQQEAERFTEEMKDFFETEEGKRAMEEYEEEQKNTVYYIPVMAEKDIDITALDIEPLKEMMEFRIGAYAANNIKLDVDLENSRFLEYQLVGGTYCFTRDQRMKERLAIAKNVASELLAAVTDDQLWHFFPIICKTILKDNRFFIVADEEGFKHMDTPAGIIGDDEPVYKYVGAVVFKA